MKRLFAYFFAGLLLLPLHAEAASIAPSVLEVTAKRGQVLTELFTIVNASGSENTYYVEVIKFEPTQDGAGPKFIPYEEDHAGLPEWIVLPMAEVRVPANSKGDVPFEIAIPSDVASGGYYGAITVSQSPADLVASNGAIVEAKTAMLLLLTVEGETVESLELLDFTDHGGSLRSDLAQSFSYRVQNQGNVHLMPLGSVTIKDLFGRTITAYDANAQMNRILPGSTREYQVNAAQIDGGIISLLSRQMKALAVGPMTATLSITYGTSQQFITASSTFWYVPWQLLIALFILIMLGILLFTRKRNTS